MEYHPLPPVSTMINGPQSNPSHSQLQNNVPGNQILLMQTPLSNDEIQKSIQNSVNDGMGIVTHQLHPNGNLNQQQNQENRNQPNNHSMVLNNAEETNRWTQYQVQQLWRHHTYLNGKVYRF